MVKCVIMDLIPCLFSGLEHFPREVLCYQDKCVRIRRRDVETCKEQIYKHFAKRIEILQIYVF
jgi:hypothetical protein